MSSSIAQACLEVSPARPLALVDRTVRHTPRHALWPKPLLVTPLPAPADVPRDLGSLSDACLVELSLAGDTGARAALFARHARMVRAMAIKLAGPQYADDVAQDALLEALSALARIDNPHAFKSWLLGVTVRVAKRRFRAYGTRAPQRCNEAQDVTDEPAGSSVPPDVALELKDMGALLSALPANLQHLVQLRRIDGLKLEEVAGTLGVSLATVKRWLLHVDAHLGAPVDTLLDVAG